LNAIRLLHPDSDASPANGGEDALRKVRIVTEIRSAVQEVRDLPTLPNIAIQAMRIASNKNSSAVELEKVINVDVALTGKILRTANSAYYGVPRKIDSLRMALVVIGMDEISNLVTTSSILKMFPSRPGIQTFDVAQFWFHSAAVAELTTGLYDVLSLPRPGAAYVSGLLHDLGRLILYQYFNHYHVKIMELIERRRIPTHQTEIEVIGVDHGHIGGWLIQRWNLPEEIINAVSQHHIRPQDTPQYSLPVMIDRANSLFYHLMNSQPDETAAFLRDDRDWQEWIGSRGAPISTIVANLFGRLDRARSLLDMMR